MYHTILSPIPKKVLKGVVKRTDRAVWNDHVTDAKPLGESKLESHTNPIGYSFVAQLSVNRFQDSISSLHTSPASTTPAPLHI